MSEATPQTQAQDKFNVGQLVWYIHCDGRVPAKVLSFGKSGQTQVQIMGWMGKHYVSTADLAPRMVN